MITRKVIIGTANLNSNYGLIKNSLKIKDFRNVLKFCKKLGIKIIDTSPNYSNSEIIIGRETKKFEIITKIPKIPKKIKKIEIVDWIFKKIYESSANTKTKKFYGVLLQNADILLSSKSLIIYKTLQDLKKKGKISKIGISIYNFKILEKILDQFKIDFIQVPFNVFDRRILNKKILKKIKKKGVKIHVRSIFLQGLLIEKNFQIPSHLSNLKKNLKNWHQWLKKNNIDPLNGCIEFVSNYKQIDKFVIGFNNFKQFNQIINFKKKNLNFKKLNLNLNEKSIDPRKW
jgi:aryl-alcohol dehydrogenase-like predicted oxidoreductase